MNHRKKWAGAAVAAFVALGMLGAAAPASASDPVQTITVTGDSVGGRQLVAVQIAEYEDVLIDDGIVTTYSLKTLGSVAQFVLDYVGGAGYDTGDHGDPIDWLARQENIEDGAFWHSTVGDPSIRGLANHLATKVDVSKLEPATWSSGKAEFTGLHQGLYLILDIDESGSIVGQQSLPMIVGTEFDGGESSQTLGTIAIKGGLVTIDKDIQSAISGGLTDDADAEGNEDEDSWTASIGDGVDFVIRTNVPNYPASYAGQLQFVITDEFTQGLLPNLPDLTMTYMNGGDKVTIESTDKVADDISWWTVTPGEIAGNEAPPITSFTIALSHEAIRTLSGKPIEFFYSAEVTSDVTRIGDDGPVVYTQDTNKAKVTFTDLWSTDQAGTPIDKKDTDETDEDITYVYTFPFEILKQDMNEPHTPIPGVEFTLSRKGSNSMPEETQSFSTGTNGKISFNGLDAGEWYLVEETDMGNSGYADANMTRTPFAVRIVADVTTEGYVNGLEDGSEGEVPPKPPVYEFATYTLGDGDAWPTDFSVFATGGDIEKFVNVDWYDDVSDAGTNHKVTVYNVKNAADMPSTGGQILLIVGIAGVLGLGAITFGAVGLRKRKALAAAAA